MLRFNPRSHKNIGMVVVCFGFVFVFLYGGILYYQTQRLKEVVLINELRTLRNTIVIFKFMNGRNPNSFQELADSSFKLGAGDKRRYVPQNIADSGFADPFGGHYVYDKDSGWVKTTSKDYNEW